MDEVKVIIDTDPGTDDCAAITHFLQFTNVIALTTVFGNRRIETTTRHACRILHYLNYSHVPVYMGARCDLAGLNFGNEPSAESDRIHGCDGLNGTDVMPAEVEKQPEPGQYGPTAIIELAKKHPGEVVLVAIGPLTNIAIASRLCPDLPKLLKAVYIMGGSSYQGNITRWAEFNFHCDPLAAHVSLQHFCRDAMVHLVPWETCMENRLDFPSLHGVFEGCNTPASRLLSTTYMTGWEKEEEKKGNGYVFADQFIPLTFLHPDTVLKKEVYDTLRVNTLPSDPKYGLAEYIKVDNSANVDRGLTVYTKYSMDMMAKLYYRAIRRIK